jgi:hypothetical protein
MRAGINIPELSITIFFCPAHPNFLCPIYPGLTVLPLLAKGEQFARAGREDGLGDKAERKRTHIGARSMPPIMARVQTTLLRPFLGNTICRP